MMEVKALLDSDEPDYDKVTELGPDALEHLQVLAESGDEMMESKAAYAASLLDDDVGADMVAAAAASDNDVVRVAAAAALRNLSSERASMMTMDLAGDDDEGVGKVAGLSAAVHEDQMAAPTSAASEPETSPEPEANVSGMMPGEETNPAFDVEPGMMPGETAESSQSDGSGLMPGEEPAS